MPDPPLTLAELSDAHQLDVSCRCAATVYVVPALGLAARYGAGTKLADLAQRFRCRRCGERDARVVLLERYTIRQAPPQSRVVCVVREGGTSP